MISLLLAIIYLAFISLGLPDSLLGSTWPIMQPALDVPLSYAGIITMLIASGTIVSSLLSDRLTKRFGAGVVTAVSVALTAGALFGFSVSSQFWMFCLLAIPYGLGAGAVDAALNNFVALHYSSRHMSWLHCFWGVGTIISPSIMSACLSGGRGWAAGYRTIALLQIALSAVLVFSLPLWKKVETLHQTDTDTQPGAETPTAKSMKEILAIPGVGYILLAFLGYCGLESTVGLWASSYLVLARGVAEELAVQCGALFFLGITIGRFISGFIADKLGDKNMIRLGLGVTALGVVVLALPATASLVPMAGLVLMGLGCAPIYPSIIHATPANFGKENSQAVIGVQMASAYVGSTLVPPLFGLIAQHINIGWFVPYAMVFVALMIGMTEALNRRQAKLAAERNP